MVWLLRVGIYHIPGSKMSCWNEMSKKLRFWCGVEYFNLLVMLHSFVFHIDSCSCSSRCNKDKQWKWLVNRMNTFLWTLECRSFCVKKWRTPVQNFFIYFPLVKFEFLRRCDYQPNLALWLAHNDCWKRLLGGFGKVRLTVKIKRVVLILTEIILLPTL